MAKSRAAKARQRERAAAQEVNVDSPLRIRAPLIAALFMLVIGVTLLIVSLVPNSNGARINTAADRPTGVANFEVSSQRHVAGTVSYAQTPPVGGDHAPAWQNCGAYADPVPTEQAVHSLEHGAVWITYASNIAVDERAALQRIAADQTYVLASPWKGEPLRAPIVASAWGYQLELTTSSDPRLDEFLRTFRQGSQAPEPGAPCTRGVGSPL